MHTTAKLLCFPEKHENLLHKFVFGCNGYNTIFASDPETAFRPVFTIPDRTKDQTLRKIKKIKITWRCAKHQITVQQRQNQMTLVRQWRLHYSGRPSCHPYVWSVHTDGTPACQNVEGLSSTGAITGVVPKRPYLILEFNPFFPPSQREMVPSMPVECSIAGG